MQKKSDRLYRVVREAENKNIEFLKYTGDVQSMRHIKVKDQQPKSKTNN